MSFKACITYLPHQAWIFAHKPVRFEMVKVPIDVPPHNHEFTELCFVIQGHCRHRTENSTQMVTTGDVIIMPPGTVHAFEEPHDLRVVNICYLADWMLWDIGLLWQHEGLVPLFFASELLRRPDLLRAYVFSLDEKEQRFCQHEIDDILAEYQEPKPSLFLVHSAFAKFLLRLARSWVRQNPNLNDFVFRPEVWDVIQEIDLAIKRGEVFMVGQYAQRVACSADVLYRVFRQATGLSVSAYYQQRRVQHAAHLLLLSKLSVTEISSQLGYADTAHLTRCFVKAKGVSPRAFRMQTEKNLP